MIQSSISLPASFWQAVSGKRLEGQLRLRARFLSESWATMIHPTLNCRPPWGSQKCDTVIDFTAYECVVSPLGCKHLEGQLRMGARFLSESRAAMIHPTLNCRPPLGSQKCDTVDEINVCVQIARRIPSRVLTDSSARERDFGANLCSPEINCRPPWGRHKCDTVVEFSVCVMIAMQIHH